MLPLMAVCFGTCNGDCVGSMLSQPVSIVKDGVQERLKTFLFLLFSFLPMGLSTSNPPKMADPVPIIGSPYPGSPGHFLVPAHHHGKASAGPVIMPRLHRSCAGLCTLFGILFGIFSSWKMWVRGSCDGLNCIIGIVVSFSVQRVKSHVSYTWLDMT